MKFFGYAIGLVLVMLVLGYLPVNRRQSMEIGMPPYQLLKRLADSGSYQHWLVPEGVPVLYRLQSPVSGFLSWRQGNDSIYLLFSLQPSVEPGYSNLQFQWRERWGVQFTRLFGSRSAPGRFLFLFKQLVEDPARRYGFNILLHPVVDSLIVTRTAVAPQALADSTWNSLFHLLRAEMQNARIVPKADYAYLSAVGEGNGEVLYAVGIPVSQRPPATSSLQVLALPSRGRLITGHAILSQKEALAKAMDDYVYDQRLKRVAQPMERYPFDTIGLLHNPKQAYQLIFPVY